MAPRDLQLLVFGLGLATAMQFYTFDAVNLILPDMAGAFGATRDEASWILIAYSAGLLLGTPLSSYLARRVGMLPYLVGSILVFLACSIGASLSTRLEEMLVFRSIEGFAGGTLNFWWRGSVYIFLTGPLRSEAMKRISTILYSSTAIGLLTSGFLVDHLNWRFICVIDAVFAAAALSLLLRYYPRQVLEPDRQGAPLDTLGVGLFAVILISAEVVLSRGTIDDWLSSPVLATLAWVAAIALVLFVFRAFDADNPNPLLRLRMLRDRDVLASVVIGTFTGAILAGAIYALPEYLRTVDPQPRSASQTGQVLCVYAIAAAFLRPLATPAQAKYGQRRMTAFALVSLVASMLLMARFLTENTPAIYYALPLILYAFCLAPLLSAVGSGTAARVPGGGQIDAVAIYMTFRQFGTALGVALVNIVISQRETLHSSRLFEHLRQGAPGLRGWLGAVSARMVEHDGRTAVDGSAAAIGALREISARQASVLAYADVFRVMAVIGVAALMFVPLMSPPPKTK